MKTRVRIVTQDRIISLLPNRATHEVVEVKGKLFREDGTVTKKGSDLLRTILNKALEAGKHTDEKGRNVREITVWIIDGSMGIPGLVE